MKILLLQTPALALGSIFNWLIFHDLFIVTGAMILGILLLLFVINPRIDKWIMDEK